MKTPVYGLMAEFESPTALAAAAREVREKGYRKVEAYSPFPIEEVNEALGLHHNRLPLIVLCGGILGGLTGYFLQYYVAVINFPLNIAGRPLHSWPSFIIITFELTVLFIGASTACRRDMQDQPKYIPLRPSDFFADGRSARPLPEGTVARGELRADKVFFTGKNGDDFVDRIPFPVTRAVLDRGQERVNIYCSPCHGRLGNGLGMIVRRGFKRPPSYHIDRLRQIQLGYFYDII